MPYIVYDSVRDLKLGSSASRGAGKIWRAGATLLEEAAAGASDHHVTSAAGVKFYVLPKDGVISIGDFGLSPGDNIGSALEAAWNRFVDLGGTIRIPPGRWLCDNRTFQQTNSSIRIQGTGTATEIYPSNPVAGTFMWDFESAASVTRLEIEDITVTGQVGSGEGSARERFNGIVVGNSNYVRLRNCQGRFVDGTAFKFQRNFNSEIDVTTYICGNSTQGDWALHITGDPTGGSAFNDCILAATSEQDQLGVLLEGCSGILRTRNRLKIHGSTTAGRAVRGLQIHRCTDFDLAVDLTRGCTGPGFVHISDANNGDGVALAQAHADAPSICQGKLDLRVLKNFTVAGTGQTFDLVTIDLAAGNSTCVLTGQLENIATPSGSGMDLRYIRLAAPGLAGAFVDLSGVLPTNADTSKLVDDQRTAGGTGAWQYNATMHRLEEV